MSKVTFFAFLTCFLLQGQSNNEETKETGTSDVDSVVVGSVVGGGRSRSTSSGSGSGASVTMVDQMNLLLEVSLPKWKSNACNHICETLRIDTFKTCHAFSVPNP